MTIHRRHLILQGKPVLGTGEALADSGANTRHQESADCDPLRDRAADGAHFEARSGSRSRSTRWCRVWGTSSRARSWANKSGMWPWKICWAEGRFIWTRTAFASAFEGKVVMVTGAAGSIGSELCRQIARFRPLALVGFDEAETPLFHLGRELAKKLPRSGVSSRRSAILPVRIFCSGSCCTINLRFSITPPPTSMFP